MERWQFLIEKDQYISLIAQYELSNAEIIMSKINIGVNNRHLNKNMVCVRIGTKSSSSYIKVTTRLNLHIISPLIKIRQLNRNFLKSISIDISDAICWSKNENINDSGKRKM